VIKQGKGAEGRPSRPVVNATDNAAREAIAGRALGLQSAARPPGRGAMGPVDNRRAREGWIPFRAQEAFPSLGPRLQSLLP